MEQPIDPRAPCVHPPGSPGKVEVLRQRAALMLPLFLDADADHGATRSEEASLKRPTHRRNRRRLREALAYVKRALLAGVSQRTIATELHCGRTYAFELVRRVRREARRA